MSDLIRAMMAQRQGPAGSSQINLDDPSTPIQDQIAMALAAGLITPDELVRAGLLPQGSIGQQMFERYSPPARPTLQDEMAAQGQPSGPMISSVAQLDR